MHTMADMDKRLRSLPLLGGHGAWNSKEMASQDGRELFTTKDGSCELIRGFGGLLNRNFE